MTLDFPATDLYVMKAAANSEMPFAAALVRPGTEEAKIIATGTERAILAVKHACPLHLAILGTATRAVNPDMPPNMLETPEIAELRRRYRNYRALAKTEPGLNTTLTIAGRLVLDLVTPQILGELLGEPWDE